MIPSVPKKSIVKDEEIKIDEESLLNLSNLLDYFKDLGKNLGD